LVRKIDLNNFQVASAKTARDINRRILLNLIRKYQPVSRADLSRHSRLQRSTISAITEQLIAERWVTLGAVGDLPRGRKPTFLHLNEDRAGIIGVDIRPRETTIALADLSLRFLTKDSMLTGHDPKRFVADLCRRLNRIVKSYPHIAFEGIGVALPGRVDLASGRLVFAPNLGWSGLELKRPLEQATALPVTLENAANACALAEVWNGGYEDVRNLIALTVSEGIGVGMLLNGQLVRGSGGLAGEFGHVSIQEDGPQCACGNKGCLEACGSNSAAVSYYLALETARTGAKPETSPTFEGLLNLAEQSDRSACRALERMACCLGAGAAMLVTGLAPDVIVIVGEVTRAWARVGPIINRVVKERLPTQTNTRIVPTDTRTQPRLRGTIALVLQEHFGAPHLI
jgi:predicted NBD/HSP70 family sugar kinase